MLGFRIRSGARRLALIIGILLFAGALVAAAAAAFVLAKLPDPSELFSRRVVQSTKIYDRSGAVLLYEIHGEEKRTIIPLSEIPAAAKNAAVAIEDANFFRHPGVDLKGILRALAADLASADFRQGGSTITQQLVKNSFLGRERTLTRKFKEAVYALALEARMEKDKILDLYLNQIPYGQNAYGIEAAAQTFFGKRARDLSAGESALLAALPRAPSYYSPYGQHKEELLARKDIVLERMAELGYLTADEAEAAQAETLKFLPAAKNIRAPHFTMYVRDYLNERYGEEEVDEGGLIVTTTLDWELQSAAERIVGEYAGRNESLIKAANMALVAVDPKSGDVLAMVGSSGWTSDFLADPLPLGCSPGVNCRLDPYVNSALRPRQPGSAFKPFVYATAFAKGLTPETALFDVPTEFNPGCSPDGSPRPGSGVKPEDCYHPQNYDETFRGPVSMRQAIAQSLNLPSVKVLYLAGVEDSIRTAEAMGLTTLKDRSRFGLSLVLGGAEVRLLEMTSAFSALANDGVLNPYAAILRISDSSGKILEEKRDASRPAIDPEISRIINDVLSDNEARIPVFQPRSSLYFPGRRVAAKTGTTQDFRDAWTIGYAPAMAVGVWAGNSDNSPMQQKGSGVMAAAPAWHEFMALALGRFAPEEFPSPAPRQSAKPALKGMWQGDTVVTVDTISGKRATDLTPPETRKDIAFGRPHDPLYWIDRSDPAGPPLENPEADPQFSNWEAAFERWLKNSGFQPRPLSEAPRDFDDVHTEENRPRISAKIKSGPDGVLVLSVRIEARYDIKEISVLAGERIIASRSRPESNTEFVISGGEIGSDITMLEIRAYDAAGNIGRLNINLAANEPEP